MSRLFLLPSFFAAVAALSAPALADTRPATSVSPPTSIGGKFIASGGTIAPKDGPVKSDKLPPCVLTKRGC